MNWEIFFLVVVVTVSLTVSLTLILVAIMAMGKIVQKLIADRKRRKAEKPKSQWDSFSSNLPPNVVEHLNSSGVANPFTRTGPVQRETVVVHDTSNDFMTNMLQAEMLSEVMRPSEPVVVVEPVESSSGDSSSSWDFSSSSDSSSSYDSSPSSDFTSGGDSGGAGSSGDW